MNTATSTAKNTDSLKQILIREAKALKGMCISKRNLVNKIAALTGFEKGYVRVLIRKCTVNDSCRARWGKSADLFALTETGLLVSNPQTVAKFEAIDDVDFRAALKVRRESKKIMQAA